MEKNKEYIKNEETGQMEMKCALENVKNEIKIMKELNHVCLIRLYEVIEDSKSDKLLLGCFYLSN